MIELWQANADGCYDHPEDLQERAASSRFSRFRSRRDRRARPLPLPHHQARSGCGARACSSSAAHQRIHFRARLAETPRHEDLFSERAVECRRRSAERHRARAALNAGRASRAARRAALRHRIARRTRDRVLRRMSIHPADSQIFGALYGTDETRALFSDHAHLQFMLDVEAALARAESSLGLIPAPVADAISRAARAENLRLDYIAESTRRVGYPVVALVKELGRIAGDEAARFIHLGATTQDILDTALVLQLQRAFTILRRDLLAIARALADRAARFRDTPIAGRTHLQHAVPTTFGLKCATWASPLVTHIERLDQAAPRVLVVQFGGAAGTLASLGAEWTRRRRIAGARTLTRRTGVAVARSARRICRNRFNPRIDLRQPVEIRARHQLDDANRSRRGVGAARRRPGWVVHDAAKAQSHRERVHPGGDSCRARIGARDVSGR